MESESLRKCTGCGELLPPSMFYLKMEASRAKREKRRNFKAPCRNCQRERDRKRIKPRRDYCDAIKSERGCADCGLKNPQHPEIFDFDHLDASSKTDSIALLVVKGTFQGMIDEIEKCEVVCANCHRIRTRTRGSNRFGGSQTMSRVPVVAVAVEAVSEQEPMSDRVPLFDFEVMMP